VGILKKAYRIEQGENQGNFERMKRCNFPRFKTNEGGLGDHRPRWGNQGQATSLDRKATTKGSRRSFFLCDEYQCEKRAMKELRERGQCINCKKKRDSSSFPLSGRGHEIEECPQEPEGLQSDIRKKKEQVGVKAPSDRFRNSPE